MKPRSECGVQSCDKESGLYYLRARYYDSQLGRFIYRDPIGMADDVNLYSYVGNSPVMKVDLLGLWGVSMNDVKDSLNTAVDYVNREKENIKYMGVRASCKVKQIIADTGDKVAEYTDYLLDSIDLYDMLESGGRGMQRAGIAAVEGGATTCAYGMSISLGCGAYTAYFATTGAGVIIPASCGIPALAGCSVGFLGGAMNGLGNIMQFAGESGKARGTQIPEVQNAATVGREKHKSQEYGPGFEKEIPTPDAKGRVDAINNNEKIIIELKPNNPNAVKKGRKQLQKYIKSFKDYDGENRTGKIETYER